jgi:HEAT repeat protein/nucleoid-associated protein YgaU
MKNLCGSLICFAVLAAALSASAAEVPSPAERRRRASILVDIGRLKLELGTAKGLREALETLKTAAALAPTDIRARYWLGAACLRRAPVSSGKLDPEMVGKAGLEFQAVFKLSDLDRSSGAADLRRRAIADLDRCVGRLVRGNLRFVKWWKARRAVLLAGQVRSDMVHVVARGETLAVIARKYYGNAAMAGRITKANPGVDPRRLLVGQRLKIPAVLLKVKSAAPYLGAADRALVKRMRTAGMAAARRVAVERLGRRDCLAAVPHITEVMGSDSSPVVRAECARALGRLGDASAEPALCALLGGDSSAQCRREAAKALGKFAGRGALGKLLRALSDRSTYVVAAAIRALGKRRFLEASGPLTAALAARNEMVRRAAAEALGDLASARRMSASDYRKVKSLAAEGQGHAGAAALLALLGVDSIAAEKLLPAALSSADLRITRAATEVAARVAARGGGLDRAVVKRLLELSGSGDPATRFAAALAVARARRGKAEGRVALVALVDMLGESRAMRWDAPQPEAVGTLAGRALVEVSGKRLPPDARAWKQWLEKN